VGAMGAGAGIPFARRRNGGAPPCQCEFGVESKLDGWLLEAFGGKLYRHERPADLIADPLERHTRHGQERRERRRDSLVPGAARPGRTVLRKRVAAMWLSRAPPNAVVSRRLAGEASPAATEQPQEVPDDCVDATQGLVPLQE
jgi:hypothetical protein